jgi:hypothetical protein
MAKPARNFGDSFPVERRLRTRARGSTCRNKNESSGKPPSVGTEMRRRPGDARAGFPGVDPNSQCADPNEPFGPVARR